MRSPTLKLILSLFAAVLFPPPHAVHYGRSTDLFGKLNTGATKFKQPRQHLRNPSARAGCVHKRNPQSRRPGCRRPQSRSPESLRTAISSFSRRSEKPARTSLSSSHAARGYRNHWPIGNRHRRKIQSMFIETSESDTHFQSKNILRAHSTESTSAPNVVIANRKLLWFLNGSLPRRNRWIEAWLPGFSPTENTPSVRAAQGPSGHGASVTATSKIRHNTWIILWLKVS